MYLSYYNLAEKPFQISTDPKFLWLGEKHKEALATLKYGVLDKKGFLLLTGDVGTGKTTLINALIKSLGEDTIVAAVTDPKLELLDFLNYIATSFDIKEEISNKADFLIYFSHFLHKAYVDKKTVILIVDEAHKMSKELLEQTRLLSNLELPSSKLLNIFLIGQNELNDILLSHDYRALRQRVTITYQINPLSKSETEEYIKHRLRIAGTDKEVFNKKAIHEIYRFSRGYPRLINIFCDHALLTGYVKELKKITPAVIKECAKELSLPNEAVESKVKTSVTQKRKSRPRMRAAVYACLTAWVIFFGYLFSVGDYNNFAKNLKHYYAQTFSNLESFASKALGKETRVQNLEKSSTPVTLAHTLVQMKEPVRDSQPPAEAGNGQEQPNSAKTNKLDKQRRKSVAFPAGKVIIAFDYNTNELGPGSFDPLDKLAEVMLENSDLQAVVSGHTDTLGSTDYNKKLGVFRANIVKSYLVGKGINPSRIQAIGKGEEDPLMSNSTSEGRSANRRVEIELVAQGS
jgi:general secretion pathway protein A